MTKISIIITDYCKSFEALWTLKTLIASVTSINVFELTDKTINSLKVLCLNGNLTFSLTNFHLNQITS